MRRYVNTFLAVFSALLLGMSFYDYRLAFIPWIMVAPFLFLLYRSRSRGEAFRISFFFALAFYGAVFYWISIVSHWVGLIGYLGWVGVFLYLALVFSIAGIVLYSLARSFWSKLLLAPCFWAVLEWLQAKGMFGITAASLAYSQDVSSTIAGAAAYGGIYLVTFLILLTNTLILGVMLLADKEGPQPLKGSNMRLKSPSGDLVAKFGFKLYSVVVVLFLLFFVGYLKLTSDKCSYESTVYRAAIIQPNIPQNKKLSYKYTELIFDDLKYKMPAIVKSRSDLYLFPESLIPGIYERNFMYYSMLATYLNRGDDMVFGSDRRDAGKYYNSVYAMNTTGNVDKRYDKERLVPFGEYIPFRQVFDRMLPQSMRYMDADLAPGKEPVLFLLKGKYPYGVSVCFESIFPDVFHSQFKLGSRFFVVLTNDGWFFDTIALKLHRNATAYRAVESGSQVFFCANTGVSSIIMPGGKSIKTIAYDKSDFVTENIVFNKGETFYYRFYDWLIYFCMLFMGVFFLANVWQRKKTK